MVSKMNRTLKLSIQIALAEILLACAWVPVSRAQAPPPRHAKVELISEESAIHPGQGILLGLHFEIDDGWHIYWVNPGDSGQPPVVQWRLPQGWKPGAILWPTPRRISDHSLIDYGYENEALLIAPVRVPPDLHVGQTADLRATVEWLVCGSVCVPAQASVSLPLAVTKGASITYSRWHKLFKETTAQLPAPAPKRWKAMAGLEGNHFVLQVETGHSEMAKTFLPLHPGQMKNAVAPVITPFQKGVRVVLMKSDQLMGPISNLGGVLVMSTGRAYTINAPIVPIRSNNGR